MYKPKSSTVKLIGEVYEKFNRSEQLRNQSFSYFNDLTLEDTINESQKRWMSYTPPRDAEDDWRTQVFMPETRNKILAILSFIAANRLRAEFYARNKNSVVNKQLSQILKSLYDYSMDSERGDMKFIMATLETIIKGTVIVQDSYSYITRDIKKVTKYNPKTGSFEYEKDSFLEEDQCVQKVIPLEDVFIPNFYEPDIQKQPYIHVWEELDYQSFMAKYGKYKNAKDVPRTLEDMPGKDGDMYFYERWSSRTKEGNIGIIHYYNKQQDLHLIVANGVLITDEDRPIIYDHKRYPFAKTIFEPIAVDFFYGLSLPMKILSEQDVLNTMYNMMLDREYMSIMPFFFTSLEDEIEESSIGPFQRVQVSDTSQIREANIQGVRNSNINMVGMVRDSISNSTIDESQMGGVSDGTATAVQQARESAMRILGLLSKFMEELTYETARQRISNILQFYVTDVIEEEKELRSYNQLLSDGTYGLKIIRLVGSKDKMPKGKEVEKMAGKTDMNVEIVYITPKMLHNIDYDIQIVPASSVIESKSMQKALGLEYTQFMLQAFGDMVDRGKLFEYVNELFDKNAEQMQKQQASQEEMMQQMMMAQQGAEGTEQVVNSPRMQQLLGSPEQSISGLAQ